MLCQKIPFRIPRPSFSFLPRTGMVSVFALASSVAAAQVAPAVNQAPSPATASLPSNGDIIVTANKREQALNKVGATVAVLGAQQLAEHKIVSLADIASVIPGLSYSSSEQNTPVFTLRGVGFNEASLAAYPTVSVYLDEAPLAFPVLSTQGAFDLERIEVLKGPQGTLFGQNSTGGAINYIAAKPTNRFSAGADASYSRFNTKEFNGFISGPVTDTIKVRLAGHVVRGDDWQYAYTRDDSLGKSEVYAGRAVVDWTPTDRLRFALTLNAWQDKSDPEAGQLIAIFPQVPSQAKPDVLNSTFAPQNDRAADWSYGSHIGPNGEVLDPRPSSNRKMGQAILRTDYNVANDISLTSLTSYVAFNQRQSVDYDGTSADDTDLPKLSGNIHSFFQEVRLANGGRSPVRWIVGANIQRSRVKEDDRISEYDASSVEPTAPTVPPFNYYQATFKSDTLRRDYAFFGNVEADLSSKLTVKAGGRYTDSLTAISSCAGDAGDGRILASADYLGHVLLGGPVLDLQPGQCSQLQADLTAGPPFGSRLQQHNISWKLGVDYKPVEGVLLYANVSRGYKAGAFPTISAATNTQLVAVPQERLTSYEAGFKTTLLDRALSLNGAAFYYDYRNKQLRGKLLDPVFGVLNALVGVPKSRLYGFELEATLHPLKGLSITASGTYVNSRVLRYTGTNVLGEQQNFAGNEIPFAPKWQGLLDADYRWNAGSVRPFLGGTINARSGTSSYVGGETATVPVAPLNSEAPGAEYPFRIKGYSTVDLRAGAEWGNWRAMIWGKNVFNRYYWNSVISGYDTIYRLAGQPATYGVTVGLKF